MEIRLTHHARERMADYGITTEQVRLCCLDPDDVRSKRLSGADRLGLRFVRDFDRGTLETVGVQRDRTVVVLTAYWLVPGSAPQTTQMRKR